MNILKVRLADGFTNTTPYEIHRCKTKKDAEKKLMALRDALPCGVSIVEWSIEAAKEGKG